MRTIDDIERRLHFSRLQAKRELFEIERTSLLRDITSQFTPQERKDSALKKRLELASECSEITRELKTLGG